jgi:YcaO-like protein with predicted kinase domain
MIETVVKQYRDGTHRVVAPRETLARVRPFLPAMGITRIAVVTGLDTIGIPVVMAVRPNSRSLAVAQGKGWDLDAAKASAVMESVESFHAEHIRLPLKLASGGEMQASGHHLADPFLLPRAAGSRYHPGVPLLWVEGRDWLQNVSTWVPFQLVHTAYTTGMRFDLKTFAASSNGLASGNHVLEAVSHAICEVVERDAYFKFSLLSEGEQEARRIDLATVDHPQCRELIERCERAGVAVAAWDITSDVGLAAFRCDIICREQDPLRRLQAAGGSGCHPVRHVAFQRALTEAAQSRLTSIAGSRDDMPRHDYRHWRDPLTLERQRESICSRGSRPFTAVSSYERDSLGEDVERELELVRRAGFDSVVVVDLTQPEFDIPVVRVLIPGTERAVGADPREPRP